MTSTWPDTDSGEIIGNGRYRLGAVIGTGGMATVHRAHDLVLDRDVAVKVFRTDVAEASDSRRIEAEMKLLGSINHSGLVTLHDAAVSDDGSTAFLVMELIEGTHLAGLLADGGVTASEAAAIVAQIAGALAHIHRKGIVHRDVKPANILVRRDEDGSMHAKLADLGIARVADATRLTTAGTILGTVAYLSPEQVSGGEVAPAADVYALGLVLFECLTGERPFTGTPAESAAMRTMAQPSVPGTVAPEFQGLLDSMTRIDPAERISAAEVETALRVGDVTTRALPAATLADVSTAAMTGPTATIDSTARLPAEGLVSAPSDHPSYDESPPARATTPLDTPPTPADTREKGFEPAPEEKRTFHRGWIITGIAVTTLIVAAIVTAMLLTSMSAPEATPPPDYPAVDGELGELLGELQRSVEP